MSVETKPKAGLEDVVAGESAICYLDGAHGGKGFEFYDLRGDVLELRSGIVRRDGRSGVRGALESRGFDAHDRDECRLGSDAKRLQARPNHETCRRLNGGGRIGRRKIDGLGQKGYGGAVWIEKSQILGLFPSPKNNGWKWNGVGLIR